MSLKVIGAGVGRTGTYSLKHAITQLGLGPCYHMDEVRQNQAERVPHWTAALKGRADWDAVFKGYQSAVDWPTAGFFRELFAAFPTAKFILTTRSPQSWASSFSETIYKIISDTDQAPAPVRDWLEMSAGVIAKTGFAPGLDPSALMKAFVAHGEAVQAAIPPGQLLVYQVKDGWAPLCDFLGVPVPTGPFPRMNDRAEFWDLVSGKQ
jgi:hypothetical protein